MSHQRTLIRNEIARRIIAGSTAAGARVYQNRSQPLFDIDFPIILIYTQSDRAELKDANPMRFLRSLDLVIEIICESNSESDNLVDDLCLEVEDIIAEAITDYLRSNGNGDKLVAGLQLGDTALRTFKDGENYFASAAISVDAVYNDYLPRNKTSDLDDLETVGVEYNLNNAQHVDDRANDLIEGLNL